MHGSTTNSLASRAKRMVHHGRPALAIELDNAGPGGGCYTTADRLAGEVTLTAAAATRFDQIHIALEGSVRTAVEHMSPVAAQTRTEASHTFLRLHMPVADGAYPQPRVAAAGQTLRFPFHFVVPGRLLPSACPHAAAAADHVREAHLRLPPSMGDGDLAADDLAPAMARVAYAVKARLLRLRDHDARVLVVAKAARKIRVLPSVPEAPPLHVLADDAQYALSASKTLRKGVFRGRLGRLTAVAAQTKALLVATTAASATPSSIADDDGGGGVGGGGGGGGASDAPLPLTTATVRLRFDPADPADAAAAPPRLGSLSARIRAITFYSARPVADLASTVSSFDISRGVYTTSIPLATRCIANVSWTRRLATSVATPPEGPRHDSSFPAASESSADGAGAAAPVYETTVLVPLTLPRGKTWLPTFHACFVSRVYLLDVSLTAHSPGTAVPATTLQLHLPLQLSTASAAAADALPPLANVVSLRSTPSGNVVGYGRDNDAVAAAAAARDDVPPPDYYVLGRAAR